MLEIEALSSKSAPYRGRRASKYGGRPGTLSGNEFMSRIGPPIFAPMKDDGRGEALKQNNAPITFLIRLISIRSDTARIRLCAGQKD